MDSMLMRNSVTGNEMWLVNKVDEISDEEIDKYMKKWYLTLSFDLDSFRFFLICNEKRFTKKN